MEEEPDLEFEIDMLKDELEFVTELANDSSIDEDSRQWFASEVGRLRIAIDKMRHQIIAEQEAKKDL